MSRKFYIENNETIPAIQYVETQPVGFSLVTDENTLKELYVKQYNTRETDGQNYFNDFRADLMLDIINLVYTPEQVFVLENLCIDNLSRFPFHILLKIRIPFLDNLDGSINYMMVCKDIG